jgi:hypothetical protein
MHANPGDVEAILCARGRTAAVLIRSLNRCGGVSVRHSVPVKGVNGIHGVVVLKSTSTQ